ncbi:gamma-glutamyltransferase [Pseudonocardia sp. NPDC049154]|uniref:gamma-glutamyltransferase n=1 Tax=Pseudonocardia sp. NPDC049154 TaxID=3155501 RepID=UPI0033CC5371
MGRPPGCRSRRPPCRGRGRLGPRPLRTGMVAARLVASPRERGVQLAAEDLAGPALDVVRPRTLRFRGHEVHVPAGPSGGASPLQALAIWQRQYPKGGPVLNGVDRTRRLALTLRQAFRRPLPRTRRPRRR